MNYAVCTSCKRKYKPVDPAIFIFEMNRGVIYRIWSGELLECLCDNQIISPCNLLSAHWLPDIKETMNKILKNGQKVFYWSETSIPEHLQ